MNQSPPLFVDGVELASFVASSNLLSVSWEAIQAARHKKTFDLLPVRLEIVDHPNCTVAAFVTSETGQGLVQEGGGALTSSDTLSQANCLHFGFLLSGRTPSFLVHQGAVELFSWYLDHLSKVKAEWVDQNSGKFLKDKTLIITGLSLGGSVASLFTLWLLDSISRKSSKLPLCVTFGSPLLGDHNFQQAISDCSRWDSCFLHVACAEDPVPRSFVVPDSNQGMALSSQASAYKPFGTFLFCSQSECACADDPEVVLTLLVEGSRSQDLNGVMQANLYERIMEQTNSGVYRRGRMQLDTLVNGSHETGIISLLEAAGVQITQDQQQRRIHDILKEAYISNRAKKVALSSSTKLNGVKERMAQFEWYKKLSKQMGMGYYDSYKKMLDRRDLKAITFKRYLFGYWHQTVTDAVKKPQKEGANIRMAWLYAGTNYRRMVEPLQIAEYYRDGNKRDYENQGRPEHFKLLEEWQMEDPEKSEGVLTERKKKNVSNSLTEDSLFWARVEEAIICCRILRNAARQPTTETTASSQYLQRFEGYVMAEIDKYALSPEVFLPQSSFMTWWNEFKELLVHQAIYSTYSSNLFQFMEHIKYKDYEVGNYHP